MKVWLLVLLGFAFAIPSAASAVLPDDCHRAAAGEPTLVLAPPSAQVIGWAPACVVVANGASVQWAIAEWNTHSVYFHGCYDSGQLVQASTVSLRTTWDQATGRVLVGPDASHQRACDPLDIDGNAVIEPIEGGVAITYVCSVHPQTMIGKIKIMAS